MFFMGLIKEILRRQEESSTEEVKSLRALVDKLTDQILGMKREGYHPAPVAHEFHRDLLSEEIMSAINSVAPTEGTTIYNDMLEYGRALIITGMPDDQIADKILKGGSYEEFD